MASQWLKHLPWKKDEPVAPAQLSVPDKLPEGQLALVMMFHTRWQHRTGKEAREDMTLILSGVQQVRDLCERLAAAPTRGNLPNRTAQGWFEFLTGL